MARSWSAGSEQNRTVSREARNAMLEDLQPEAYYRVSMVAVSQWGASERSNPPVYSKVTAAPQRKAFALVFSYNPLLLLHPYPHPVTPSPAVSQAWT